MAGNFSEVIKMFWESMVASTPQAARAPGEQEDWEAVAHPPVFWESFWIVTQNQDYNFPKI